MKKEYSIFYKTITILQIPFSFIGYGFVSSFDFIKLHFRLTTGLSYLLLICILSLLITLIKYVFILNSQTKTNEKKEVEANEGFEILE